MQDNHYISMRWEHVDKRRFYRIVLAKDLLGDWVLTKAWGGLNKASGRITHFPCHTFEAGQILISQISKVRDRRGYELRLS